MKILLVIIAVVVPVIGFIAMLNYSRGGDSLAQRRQRRRHGLIFWVLLPIIAGGLIACSVLGILPDIVAPVTVITLAGTAFLGAQWQRREEEKGEK